MTVRRLELVRAGWGLACLVAPARVVSRVGNGRADRVALGTTRVLGARQLTQGLLSGLAPTQRVLAVGVWVDCVHAATAVTAAALDRERWRPLLVDAGVAAAWAALGRRDLPGAAAPALSWQDRAAAVVLPLLPGAPRPVGG